MARSRTYKKTSHLKQFLIIFTLAVVVVAIPLTVKLVSEYQTNTSKAGPGKSYASGQILVKFVDQEPSEVQIQSVQDTEHGKKIKRKIPNVNIDIVEVIPGKELQTIQELNEDPAVEYAELDYYLYPQFIPNDEYFPMQYGLQNLGQEIWDGSIGSYVHGTANADIKATTAWDKTQGAGIKVAVLDTGIDLDHPDLASKIVGSANLSEDPGSVPYDDVQGHGTMVAGNIAAVTNNGEAIASVCPQCQLLNVKIARDSDGRASYSSLINGVRWAADNGAKVINITHGAEGPQAQVKAMQDAINYARGKGAVVVVAAGNSGSGTAAYPGAFNNVIAVGATNYHDQKIPMSNYGTWVDIAAPGLSVPTTTKGGGRGHATGTSMATSFVSGTAALIRAMNPSLNADSIENQLLSTADRIAGTGSLWSSGRVNAAAAVATTAPSISAAPTAPASKPNKKKKKKKKKKGKKKGSLITPVIWSQS